MFLYWPDTFNWSWHLLRPIAASVYGGGEFNECYNTAQRIKANDPESWHTEWLRTADHVRELARRAEEAGHIVTAHDHYLRASNYYRWSEAFLDHADAEVSRIRAAGRKGWLPAFRDAALFKVAYAYGLRRNEARMLDVADFGRNAHAPEFGDRGVCYVRHGKAIKGSPPKPRSVLTVWPWAGEVLEEWVSVVRPLFGRDGSTTTRRNASVGGRSSLSRRIATTSLDHRNWFSR